MSIVALDLLIRAAAGTVMLCLALLFARQRREIGAAAWLFAPFALCVVGFLAGNTAGLRPEGPVAIAARIASGTTVVFLWWFCLACFDRGFRPRGGVLLTGLIWVFVAQADRLAGVESPLLSYGLLLLGYAIVAHLVWRLHAERDDDMVAPRRDARGVVALGLGGLLFVDLTIDLLLGFDWRPMAFAVAQNGAILGFALWLGANSLGVRTRALHFAGVPSPVAARQDPLLARLEMLIAEQRIHLDPAIDFAGFVRKMAAPERAVRQLVNRQLGFDHFRAFLNHHRVEEACRLMADPARSGDKLVAIAFDSGFASLPSFNRAFRTLKGCAPGVWRERQPAFENRSALF